MGLPAASVAFAVVTVCCWAEIIKAGTSAQQAHRYNRARDACRRLGQATAPSLLHYRLCHALRAKAPSPTVTLCSVCPSNAPFHALHGLCLE